MVNTTVTGTSTVTVWLIGTPSYGTPPDNKIEGGNNDYCILLSKNQAPLTFRHPFTEIELLISIGADLYVRQYTCVVVLIRRTAESIISVPNI